MGHELFRTEVVNLFIKIEKMEMHITSCEMMSSSLGCRNAFCQTGCISDGQITRDRFNNDLLDERPSSNMKYLSDLVLPILLTTTNKYQVRK